MMLTTIEAAALMGISESRVKQLASAGRIVATKHGRDWAIDEDSARSFAPLPAGRPKREELVEGPLDQDVPDPAGFLSDYEDLYA